MICSRKELFLGKSALTSFSMSLLTSQEDLLAAFQAYCWKQPMAFAAFEPVPDEKKALLRTFPKHNPLQISNLTIIGQREDASLAAIWRYSDKETISQAVVWISSDGIPTGVIADSLADFLSLLPYSTSFIYDALWVLVDHKKEPDRYPSIEQEFPVGEELGYLKGNRSRGAGYAGYIRWLAKTANLSQTPAPVSLMKQAFEKHPDFSEWFMSFYNTQEINQSI
jgi:hypothetical protein